MLENWSAVSYESKVFTLLRHSITPILHCVFRRCLAVALFVVAAILPAVGEACPGCNAAMDNTVGRGFNMSVLFLMGMPFFVFGAIAVGIVFVKRKEHSAKRIEKKESRNGKADS